MTTRTPQNRHAFALLASLALTLALSLPASALAQGGGQAGKEAPLPPETHPLGDIPDSQVFVPFQDPAGFTLEVPEGWARTGQRDHVHFQDKYNSVDVQASNAQAALPTVDQAKQTLVQALENQARAVQVTSVERVTLPAGPAIHIAYTSNSDPNPVTGKQIRLENERYVLVNAGQQVALTFSAPQGADNVDAWRLMSQSFGWS